MAFLVVTTLKYWARCLLELLFPDYCVACNTLLVNQEQVVCTQCWVEMPKTHFHKQPDNVVEKIFWGRVPIERATSLFFFEKKSKYQHLIHALKYKNRPDVGVELGRLLALELKQNPEFSRFDAVVPVPLHPAKEKKRGYNQSYQIALGMSEVMGIPVLKTALLRNKNTSTQTRKSRFERSENMAEVFVVAKPMLIQNKHVLLVDDILTTGATLEQCALALKQSADVKISIATLGYARLS